MKTDRILLHKSYITIGMLFLSCLSLYGKRELKSLTDFLEVIIDSKEQYDEKKEQEIHSLKKLLEKEDASLEYRYEVNYKLYNEYKKYKLDTAIYYAQENVRIAEELTHQHLKYSSAILLASVYSYAGKILESEEILKNIPSHQLSKELLPDYYETYSRFYEHYSAVSGQRGYYDIVESYRDSLLSVLDPSTYRYKINIAHKYINARKSDQAIEILHHFLVNEETETPEYALITYYLGIAKGLNGDTELEKKYLMLSAIADVKNSIKENASFQRLANIYYDHGDLSKAFRYTQCAIEDAVFSGVQFRTAQMTEFYSIINAAHQLKEAKTNSKLKTYLFLISILSFFLILLVGYVYKQMKRLSRIKEELSHTNGKLNELIMQLNQTNNLINEQNEQLLEANETKEQYIAQFFNLCSTYIDKMEEFRNGLYKLAISRKYEDLIKRLRSTTAVENEQEELYRHFDSIFLSLYPTFVKEFNSLLDKREQIQLKSDDLLNKELRIYALLRLGITDSTKIAGFLRCSMSTVYNYRTKMRNKAVINRDKFEEIVMQIGTKPST